MKNIVKSLIAGQLVLLFFQFSVFGQEVKQMKIDKLIPKVPSVTLPDTVMLNEFLKKQTAFEVRDDISVNLDLNIDLSARIASGKYEIKNTAKRIVDVEYSSPLTDNKLRRYKIQPGRKVVDKFTQDISVSKLTTTTNFALIRPYILMKKSQKSDLMLVANHTISMKVIIPEKARVLKSSIPFKSREQNLLTWELSGVKIIPPIYLWYTTAELDLELTKDIQIEDTEVLATLVIKNKSGFAATNLLLTTQFPSNAYTPDRGASDGEFILQNNVMYRWNKKLELIRRGSEYTVKYKLLKDSMIPYDQTEILIYDQNGDLVLID